jgi:hypothetical protein
MRAEQESGHDPAIRLALPPVFLFVTHFSVPHIELRKEEE